MQSWIRHIEIVMQKIRMHRKSVIVCVLAAVVLLAGIAWKAFAKRGEKQLFAVTVKATEYTGQGTVYRQQGDTFYIVTAGHILDGLSEGESCLVEYGGGEEREARVLYRSESADMAFLELSAESGETKLQAVWVSREHFDVLTEGDRLWAVAYSDGFVQKTEGALLDFWVYLEDFSLNMMLAKIDCRAGMSGCAILEENGYFTGILCGMSETGEAAVLPYSIIESEWIQMVERGILK